MAADGVIVGNLCRAITYGGRPGHATLDINSLLVRTRMDAQRARMAEWEGTGAHIRR